MSESWQEAYAKWSKIPFKEAEQPDSHLEHLVAGFKGGYEMALASPEAPGLTFEQWYATYPDTSPYDEGMKDAFEAGRASQPSAGAAVDYECPNCGAPFAETMQARAKKLAQSAPSSGQPASADPVEALIARITDCLAKGGLFNMEVMEAGKVRDLLIDCRRQLESALRASRTAGGGVTFSEMANPQDLSLSEQCCDSCGIAFFFMEAKDGDCSTQEVTFCPGCGRPRAALATSRTAGGK